MQPSLVVQGLRSCLPMQCTGHRFVPWSRKIPHAVVQLSPCITTTECSRAHEQQLLSPQIQLQNPTCHNNHSAQQKTKQTKKPQWLFVRSGIVVYFFFLFFKVSTMSKYFSYRERKINILLLVILVVIPLSGLLPTHILIKAVRTQMIPYWPSGSFQPS